MPRNGEALAIDGRSAVERQAEGDQKQQKGALQTKRRVDGGKRSFLRVVAERFTTNQTRSAEKALKSYPGITALYKEAKQKAQEKQA